MRGTASVCTVAVATAEGSVMSGEQTSREACPRPADVADGRAGEKSETRDSMQSRTESRNPTSLSTPSCSPMTGCSETDRHRLPKWLAVNYPQTKDLWALDVEKSSCIGHDNISHLSWVFTKDKRESPRLQSWDESASMFFLILDISDYGISRNASDRLAEIRTRP